MKELNEKQIRKIINSLTEEIRGLMDDTENPVFKLQLEDRLLGLSELVFIMDRAETYKHLWEEK